MIMNRESSNNSWIALQLRLMTLLLAFDLLFAFSAVVSSSGSGSTSSISQRSSSNNPQTSFFRTITTWLDQEEIPWRRHSKEDKVFPKDIEINNPIIEVVTSHHSSTLYYLHIIKSPRSRNDCLSPICTRDMTNYVQYLNTQSRLEQQQLTTGGVAEGGAGQTELKASSTTANKISIIHLHEDVWHSKTDIVQCRLRTRLIGHTNSSNRSKSSESGRSSNNTIPSRIYARKTKAKRIDAGTAIPFLEEHHLWSATKARYYYGLFLPVSKNKEGSRSKEEDDDVLVAVATFSTKRKIQRGPQVTRSHELIRFCSRADSTVIGGITKLLRTFITEQSPVDDIITVVDRDWGPGDGWHSLGFETLHVSAPLFMVVNKKDGVRRHLVGAGIQSKNKSNSNNSGNNDKSGAAMNSDMSSGGRPGVEDHVLDELAGLHTYEDALNCLEKCDYYPVYDAGVERLLMVVSDAESTAALSSVADDKAIQEVEYIPSTYAATYRTSNSGIAALLGHVMSQTASSLYGRYLSEILNEKANVNDSLVAQSDADSWKATGGVGKSESLIYSVPSTLDPLASVEVRERAGGWCTLGFVGGMQKSSIRHGNFKIKEDGVGHRYVDSSVMVFEYLRSMAAMALVGLEYSRLHPDTSDDNETEANLSCLYLGYGAGSLPRFMASLLPGSNHLSIELDEGVVSAANQCGLLNHSLSLDSTSIELQVGDALKYKRAADSDPFDVVFIDIFDDDNILPPEFYSTEFLQKVMLQNHLGGHSSGIVIHNFHTGGKALRTQLADAIKNYRDVFSTTLTVESIDSRHTGGNTILLATNNRRLDASSESLSWRLAGKMAQQHPGLNFDVIARTTHKLWLS